MAQYYASIQGAKGEATRIGNKVSGLVGHIRGWDVGGEVRMDWNDTHKRDECRVAVTSGSNGRTLFGFSAYRLEYTKQIAVEVEPEFLSMISDDTFEQAISANRELAQRLGTILFKHMDKVQR